jgi:hypothetical protein
MGSYNRVLRNKGYSFNYVKPLKLGDVIDGDLCEWNDFEQMERTVSVLYHKFVFNNNVFDIRQNPAQNYNNLMGYYYQPHNKLTIRVFSDYIEEGEGFNTVNIPDYSYFSTYRNAFMWRDIYTYGYLDQDGRGVDYPFLNGKHYPFKNFVFRIIPEGTNFVSDDITLSPTFDDCE